MTLSDDAFKQLSHSIACVRFPLVFAILMLHAYTATRGVGSGTYFRVLYPFALWFGETGVPAYFFISGLLLFYSSKTYTQQLRSRFKTLFIPYMIWNGMYLLVYVVIWIAGFHPEILDKSLDDFTWLDYVRCFWDRGARNWGNTTPVLAPMWYIRNLMVMYLISPLLYYVIRATGPIVPVVCAMFWVTRNNVAFNMQTMTMFSLGAFFPINEINPIDFWKQYKIHIIIFFIVLGTLDIYFHTASVDSSIKVMVGLPIHRMALIANSFFVIWLGTYLYDREWRFPKLSKAAFFIFCLHFPLTKAVREIANRHLEWPDGFHLFLYVVSVVAVTSLCYGAYLFLNRYWPWFIRVSTGDRG
jgi:hypothetical protein